MSAVPPATPTEAAQRRGVTELVHYTTQKGVHGTVASSALLSRARLDKDEYLQHIREPVWPRKDPAWIDHISLSVTSLNDDLFFRSRRHYPYLWWAVFSLAPEILDHPRVVFTTTNNIYPAVQRGEGVVAFEAMFAPEVAGRYGARHTREGLADSQPTTRAAEVLYPGAIATEHVQALYVLDAEHRRTVLAWCEALNHADLRVEVRPDMFS